MTYEEANWAKLSPAFRAAHNRLRRSRGLPSIPEPKICLYRPSPAIVDEAAKAMEDQLEAELTAANSKAKRNGAGASAGDGADN
jgi:hypothetical protein